MSAAMELQDVIRAMRDALDLLTNPKHYGPELAVCVRQDLAEALAHLEQAQRELTAHANSTTVLDVVETVQ